MPYTIPNYADAGANAAQAAPDAQDFTIITAGFALTGVISGCAATVTGTDMNVTIGAGVVMIDGRLVTVAGGAVALTSDPSNPRFVLITVGTDGTKYATAGTAGSNPVFPAVPASRVALHAVYLTAADAAIISNQVIDKRVMLVRQEDDFMAFVYW